MWQLNNLRLGKSLSSSGSGVTAGNPSLNLNFLGTSTLNPLVTFTRASSGTYFDSTGTLQTAGNNAARFDYNPSTLASRGLLIEEQRTNSIRNNTMVGAAAGTPGTMPTNWSGAATTNGLNRQIVGTGTSNGITYIDIRYSGTTTAGAFVNFAGPEINTFIAASNGQAWTSSAWVAVVGGSTANLTNLSMRTRFSDAGGVELTQAAVDLLTATSTMQRFSIALTASNASTAFVATNFSFQFNNGVAIDITLRIGLPQLEQGAFATSVISTTTAAATRSADVASVNTLSPWYNASAGTLFAEGAGISDANARYVACFNDGTLNEFYGIRTATNLSSVGIDGGSSQWALVNSYTSNNTFKSALAYAVNDIAFTTGGAAPVTDATATLPTVSQMQIGTGPGLPVWGGYIRRITYYPRRLSNAALQSLTA